MPYFKNVPYRFGNQVKKEQKLVNDRVTKEVKGVEGTKDKPDVTGLDGLRVEYFELAGKEADKRWKEERLEEEIAKLKE